MVIGKDKDPLVYIESRKHICYRQRSCDASQTVSELSSVPVTCLLLLAVGVSVALSSILPHVAHDVPFTVLYAAIISCSFQHRPTHMLKIGATKADVLVDILSRSPVVVMQYIE